MGVLIHDGYTLDGRIPAFGHHPEVSFRYRPALPEQVYEYTNAPKKTGKEELKAVVDLLLKHLVSWDVRDQAGETVPVTADNLKRIPHRVQQKMVDYVTGYAAEEAAADAKN